MQVLNAPLKLQTRFLGLTSYEDALALMESTLSALPPGEAFAWGLEHPLVYTSGLKTDASHILNRDLEPVPARRGGSVTLHNPGQLVVYFAWPLASVRGGLERFVRVLEAVVAEVLLQYGVPVNLLPGASGVFTPAGKIAFVGLGLKRQCIYHGISINTSNNLDDFRAIRSCGLTLPMTNVARFRIPPPETSAVFAQFAAVLREHIEITDPRTFRERAEKKWNLLDWYLGFRLGWLAFHERRYWEAHEIWELFWHEMPPGDLRIFFHALIQMAMGYYKIFTVPNVSGARSLIAKAQEKFAVTKNILLFENQGEIYESLAQCQAELDQAESLANVEPPRPMAWLDRPVAVF